MARLHEYQGKAILAASGLLDEFIISGLESSEHRRSSRLPYLLSGSFDRVEFTTRRA